MSWWRTEVAQSEPETTGSNGTRLFNEEKPRVTLMIRLLIVSHKRAEINAASQEEAAVWERTAATFSTKGLRLSRHVGLTSRFYNESNIKMCVSAKGLKWNKTTARCVMLNVFVSDSPSPVSTAVTFSHRETSLQRCTKTTSGKSFSTLTSRDSIFSFKVCLVGLREGLVKLFLLCCWNSPNNSSKSKSAKCCLLSFHKNASVVMLGRVPLDEMCV